VPVDVDEVVRRRQAVLDLRLVGAVQERMGAGEDLVAVLVERRLAAEPALDVAQFRATTKYLALAVPRPRTRSDAATASEDVTTRLGRLAAASQVCDRFQRRYAEVAPVSAERVALWETLHLFTYVLHCWTGVRPHRLHATMFLLGHHLLASGMAA